MNRIKLTDAKIKAEKAGNLRRIIAGENGLGLRITPNNKKSFIFQFRYEGIQKLMTFGSYPAMSLHQANDKLNEAKGILLKGEDPSAQKIEQKEKDKIAPTVSEFIEEFVQNYSIGFGKKPYKKTWAEDRRLLKKDVAPYIGHKKMKNIEMREIVLILDKIKKRGSGQMANRALNVISKMFNYAVGQAVIQISPCLNIGLPTKKIARQRVLNDSEIKIFWDGLEASKMSKLNKFILKFLLATGQRRGEVVLAQRKQFDLKNKMWEIPSDNVKNAQTNRIPLNGLALEILNEMNIDNLEPAAYLFPSPVNDKSIDPRATTRALNKVQKSIGLDKFTPHDLRRTVATRMAGLGIGRLFVSKLLNHKETSVTGIHYDLYGYETEKRQAMEKWNRHLQKVIFGEKETSAKVINMPTR